MQTIVYAQSLVQDLRHILAQMAKPDAVVWLFDTNTYQLCAPLLQKFLQDDAKIIVRAGDLHKDLSALSKVWSGLQSAAATACWLMSAVVCSLTLVVLRLQPTSVASVLSMCQRHFFPWSMLLLAERLE